MFDAYLNRVTYGKDIRSGGQQRKTVSDMIMNETWWEDPQSRVAYIYDYYHDLEPTTNTNRHPADDVNKTPIDIKFIITQYESISKDQVEYHMLFRPGAPQAVNYFDDASGKYGADYPVGMYIDIPDDEGIYNRWLICNREIANQFVKYSILPCNYYFHWVYNHKKYDMCGVVRLRNSYNSGEWTSYMTTTIQNQNQVWLPQNDITCDLYYNQRFIIDSRADIQGYNSYLAWHTSKVENIHPRGIVKLTLAQELFDENRDKFDPDNGYLYADYALLGEDQINESELDTGEFSKIVFNGNPNIRVAGTGKNLSVKFFNRDGEEITKRAVSKNLSDYWSIEIFNKDGTVYEEPPLVTDILTSVDDSMYTVKINIDDFNLLNKTIEIHAHYYDGTCDSVAEFNITSL